MIVVAEKKDLLALDEKADKMREAIRNAKSEYPENAKKYYVSSINGNDENDGLAPETAVKTLPKIESMDIRPGEVVLFERGSLWRGHLNTKPCVTYSAYGEGEKPTFYGEGGSSLGEDSWAKTEYPNIYVLTRDITPDCGNIIFNHGEYWGTKRFTKINRDDGIGPFGGLQDLKGNFQFFHDLDTKKLYLYCDKGNPGVIFDSVELAVRAGIIIHNHGVTIDNLCIKYTGSHGICGGTHNNLTVRNCEIGWCGGSLLSQTVRFGNAIEIYGSCEDFNVYDNYIYQMYDTGITHQFWSTEQPALMRNVSYRRNLIENCYWSIEYVERGEYASNNRMTKIDFSDNFLRFAGYGWGKIRPDSASGCHIKGWQIENPADNFKMENNIFDRSRYYLVHCGVSKFDYLPSMKNNTYIQNDGGQIGMFGEMYETEDKKMVMYSVDENFEKTLKEKFREENPTAVIVKQ